MVAFAPNETKLEVKVVSDLAQPVNVSGKLELINLAGEIVESIALSGEVMADQVLTLYRAEKAEMDKEGDQSFWHAELTAADHKQWTMENDYFPAKWKACELEPAMVSLGVEQNNNHLTIRINTDKPALFVTLETELSGRFSDNSLTLLPGRDKEVLFIPQSPVTPAKLKAATRIYHLRNCYR